MGLIGIITMDSIQKVKYIVAADYANSEKSMVYQQREICENFQENRYCWMIII